MKKQLTMKKERKLHLRKIKVYYFPETLNREEQNQARGGSQISPDPGGTAVPVFCNP